MSKLTKIVVFFLYIILLCALSLLFAYKEWGTLLFITIIFGPFLWLPAVENAFIRVAGLFGLWAVLIFGVLYFNSLFTHVIIISETRNYEIEKVLKGSEYDFKDSENKRISISVNGNCVYNKLDKPLRLYEVTYSRYQPMFGGSGEKELMEIPAYSMVSIPCFPHFILESPPNSIMVKKHGVFSGDEKTIKTVLEIVEY